MDAGIAVGRGGTGASGSMDHRTIRRLVVGQPAVRPVAATQMKLSIAIMTAFRFFLLGHCAW